MYVRMGILRLVYVPKLCSLLLVVQLLKLLNSNELKVVTFFVVRCNSRGSFLLILVAFIQ